MAISFTKNYKVDVLFFPPCFGVIPGHAWGKNGMHPIITPA